MFCIPPQFGLRQQEWQSNVELALKNSVINLFSSAAENAYPLGRSATGHKVELGQRRGRGGSSGFSFTRGTCEG